MRKEDFKIRLYRGSYCVYWRENGKSKRASLRTEDRDVAEQRFNDWLKQTEIIGETVSDIYAAYKEEKKNISSYKTLEICEKNFLPFFGALRPDQVTRVNTKEYALFRSAKGISNGTILRELGVMKAALKWHNPNTPAVFSMPKSPPPRDRYLTKSEFKLLLEHVESPHIKTFLILAISTGARTSAILELTWDRVDFNRGLIKLSKGDDLHHNKRRATVPMTDTAKSTLEEAYRGRLTDFVIEVGGKPIKSVKKGVARTAERANIKGVSPRVIRHTAAVWMAEAGIPMSEISQFLGHTNTKVTEQVYARYSPDYLRKAASALEW
jgi:integrase